MHKGLAFGINGLHVLIANTLHHIELKLFVFILVHDLLLIIDNIIYLS